MSETMPLLAPELLPALAQFLLPRLPESALFVFDADLRVLVARGRALTDAGFEPEAVEGRPLSEVLPPEDYARMEPLYRRALAGEVLMEELAVGERRYSLYASPLQNKAGAVTGVGALSQDVTARRTAADGARRSEVRYEALVSSIEGIVWEADPETLVFRYVSPGAERLLGYPLSDWLRPGFWSGAIHPDDRDWAVALCRRATEARQSHAFEYRMTARDGRAVWLRDLVTVEADGGRVTGLRGVMIDVTGRREADARLRRTLAGTVSALAHVIGRRDPYTAGHHERSMYLAAEIAARMGLPPDEQEAVWTAALLHDIGNVAVPADILNRPAPYSPAERAVMQTHAQAGYEILRDTGLPETVALAALRHHERLDGSGYPQGLRGGELCVTSRIVAVAEVLEALVSHRPYRPALSVEGALAELARGRGVGFDPGAVDACMEILREWEFDFEAFVAARRGDAPGGWQTRVEQILGEARRAS